MRQASSKTILRFVAGATLGLWLSFSVQAAGGDVKAGESKAAMCIGCHGIPGYQNTFPEVYRVPMISGQTEAYIETALAQYKKGDRKHPSMRGIAISLSDQDILDLAAFYGSHNSGKTVPEVATTPVEQVAELINKGGCVACHGVNFNKPLAPGYPKVAGQQECYLLAALKAYKVEGNALIGRNNAIMGGIAKQFTTAELKAMAAYMASLPGDVHTQPLRPFR